MSFRMQKDTIKKYLINSIKKNKKEYISLCIVLFIGVVLGVLLINNVKEDERIEVQNYIKNFIEILKDNNEIDKVALLKESIVRNISIGVLLWFIGSTVIGIPLVYTYVAYKGFCISYTVSRLYSCIRSRKRNMFCII